MFIIRLLDALFYGFAGCVGASVALQNWFAAFVFLSLSILLGLASYLISRKYTKY